MNSGMLFTSSVSFLIFITSLTLFLYLFKNRVRGDKKMLAFNLFWLVTSGLWFFASLRIFFAWRGMFELDQLFFEVDQVFVFLTPLPLLYYLILKTTKSEKISRISLYIAAFLSGISIILLFKNGVTCCSITNFITKYQPPPSAFNIFIFMALAIIVISGYDVLKRAILFFRKELKEDKSEFYYSLAILVYLLIGIFDEQGLLAGWHLVIFRLSYLGVFLLVYLVYDKDVSKKRAIIESVSS